MHFVVAMAAACNAMLQFFTIVNLVTSVLRGIQRIPMTTQTVTLQHLYSTHFTYSKCHVRKELGLGRPIHCGRER